MRPLVPSVRLALASVLTFVLVATTTSATTAATDDAFAPAPHGHANVQVRDPFVLASFNVLGAGHTPPRSGWASGVTRMKWAVQKLREHSVDVVGFQEFEPRQKEAFLAEVDNSWGVYSGSKITRDSLAWDKSEFMFVKGETILIPYFYGKLKPMPIVLLESRLSGQRMYFTNFHLPASSKRRGSHERQRDRGTRKHIVMAHGLRNEGVPVFITGDMNEGAEYFCKLTRNGDMHASNGGSNTGGVCRPPRKPNRTRIDWIFGSTGVEFDDYVADESTRSSGISDHPVVVARVH